MKKRLILSILTLTLFASLTSCRPSSSSSEQSVSSSPESSQIVSSEQVSNESVSSSESSSENSSESSSEVEKVDTPFEEKVYPEKVDYVNDLTFDTNSGRKFVKVTKKLLIDGDTSHFYIDDADKEQFPVGHLIRSDKVLKLRYLGIDTPESTGQIQEWGKTASLFNKSRLENAKEIYIESNDGKWNVDSTGSRYLGYVWYNTEEDSTLRNLNLEILQEGLSYAKSLNELCYSEVFQKAFSQANTLELPVFSKAASYWRFDDNNDVLIDGQGYVLGSTGNNINVISFKQTSLNEINKVHLYDKNFNLIDAPNDIITILQREETTEKKEAYYLGLNVNGTIHYLTGSIEKGLAYTSTSKDSAVKVYVEKDSSKAGYYNMYVNGAEEKDYITINSSNNIAYMNRDKNYYYGSYQEVTIKGLRTYSEDYVGVLVRFEGIVAKVTNDTAFVVQYDEETGLTYGIQVYMGMTFTGKSLFTVGNKLSVCGNFVYYDAGGTYQVSGLSYMRTKPNHERNTKVLEKNVEVPLKVITAEDLTKTTVSEKDEYEGISYTQTLTNTYVKMEHLTVTRVYTTNNGGDSDGAMTLTCKDSNNRTCTVRTEVLMNNGNLVVQSEFENKTITVTGIVDFYNDSYQVRVFSYKDVIFE